MHSVKHCNAGFTMGLFKKKDGHRSSSFFLPAAQTAIVKRLGKKGERRKQRFWIRPGRTSAWWDGFVSEIVLPEEWRENFRMSRVLIMQNDSTSRKVCYDWMRA